MAQRDLPQGAAHLGYELWQMTLAAAELERLNATQQPGVADLKDGVVYNALLESALLHCRELIDVLVNPNRSGDDIRLNDFGSQWTISPQDEAKLAPVKRLLNKHLVHLTWKRVDDEPDPWAYQDTIALLAQVYEQVRRDLLTQVQRGACPAGVVHQLALHLGTAQQVIVSDWSGRHFTPSTPLAVTTSTVTVTSSVRSTPPTP